MKTIFPIGRPVDPDDIVDREQFMEEVQHRLLSGHSLMLAGPRRIGKSSVAKEIRRRLSTSGTYTAQVDLFYITSVEEFAAKLLKSILENRTGALAQTVRAFQGIRKLLGRAEIHAKIHGLEVGLSLPVDDADPLTLLETAVETAEELAKADGKRMVVLLDEFQEIERLGGESLLKRLRALFQQQSHTVYLFLGSQTTLMQTLFADRRQAFYRFATFMELPLIPQSSWENYISIRFAEYGMRVTSPAFQMMYERTGGHPYCMMAVAYNAHLYATFQCVKDIDADVIHFAYEQTINQLEHIYDVQWQEIHHFRYADAILAALVDGKGPYSLSLNATSVSKALQNLLRISMITKGDGRGEYYLTEPMFGDWLRRKAMR